VALVTTLAPTTKLALVTARAGHGARANDHLALVTALAPTTNLAPPIRQPAV
jgi:hypothetical protein